ncbi:hypothetical protein PHMEG_00023468 [Phytophthora megakarya]|uniref:Uncharacterized protein n=1 Tax=Phytophthora megakarya TaxID=4795 RepID=A0A225VJ93_9STRA|nr:hypothetical protein PHMEG_00023468 [Phytophthora megakarya]
MIPTVTQALEVFSERDQVRENLSILTYTEEEEVLDYFDAEWDERNVVSATSPLRRASMETICSSCAVTDSASVLGVCTTPTSLPQRTSSSLLLSIGETLSLSKAPTTTTLYRPSDLGIHHTSAM